MKGKATNVKLGFQEKVKTVFRDNVSLVVICLIFCVCVIYNSHNGDRKLIKIQYLNVEVNELEYELSSLKKELKANTVLSKLEKEMKGKLVFPEQGVTVVGPDKS